MMMQGDLVLDEARAYWDFVYYADPTHQHTTELATLDWPPERLREGCRTVLADRRRISLEVQPPSEYYREVDDFNWTGKRVLEFGCGMGADALQLAERGAIMTVTDIVPGNVQIADRVLDGFPHTAVVLRSYDDCGLLGSFDVVFSHGVLHHIKPPLDRLAITKLINHIVPAGRMILMVYTHVYYPQEQVNVEGPYTRGFHPMDLADRFIGVMEIESYRYVLGTTCAWVVARK